MRKWTSQKPEAEKSDIAGYQKRRRIVSLCSLVILVLLFVGIAVWVGKPMIDSLKNPEAFRQWVDGHGMIGRLAFAGMMALQVVVAMIPGEPLEIAAGYVFGNVEGLLLCLLGAAVGTAVIFAFTRLLGIKMVEAFISREKIESIRFLHNPRKEKHSGIPVIFHSRNSKRCDYLFYWPDFHETAYVSASFLSGTNSFGDYFHHCGQCTGDTKLYHGCVGICSNRACSCRWTVGISSFVSEKAAKGGRSRKAVGGIEKFPACKLEHLFV